MMPQVAANAGSPAVVTAGQASRPVPNRPKAAGNAPPEGFLGDDSCGAGGWSRQKKSWTVGFGRIPRRSVVVKHVQEVMQ
jgi:hypothetical protein